MICTATKVFARWKLRPSTSRGGLSRRDSASSTLTFPSLLAVVVAMKIMMFGVSCSLRRWEILERLATSYSICTNLGSSTDELLQAPPFVMQPRDTTKKRLSHISRSVVFYTKHLPSEQPYIASKSYLRIVERARELRYIDPISNVKRGRGKALGTGRPFTSHFYIPQPLDSLLSTLELNFFITRYYRMSDRDGNRVAVFALNYGLCEKYTIEFGRPEIGRENRTYLVERAFDYAPILQDFLASNQEIRCDNCGGMVEYSMLPTLRLYAMLCPVCRTGTCHVINISKKYESLLNEVDQNSLLPATELGILQTLEGSGSPMFAGDIAGELDCSPQLVGWRSKKLAERDLVTREKVKGRRQFTATELARRIYSTNDQVDSLDVAVVAGCPVPPVAER
jgi:hypothetical protein